MKNYIVRDYQYNEFFNHYFSYDSKNITGDTPEDILLHIKNHLPSYVNTIINFGSANGRDFIPFQDNFNCVGFDLANPNIIEWVCKTDNLTYHQCSIEDYLETDHTQTDLSNCLVYTQGTLMYLTPEKQNEFINHLLNKGCKNIVFHEYPPEYTGPHTKFNPSQEYLNIFTRQHFRSIIENQPTGFIYLDHEEYK